MRNHIERFTYKDGTPGRYSSFICGNYARSGKSACTIHSIYENVLEELVLTDIREKARFVECDGERLAEQISRMKEKESRSRVISYEQELKAAAARMAELERLMQNLYEDKCTGTIPQTVFQTLMRKYETERAEKAAAIPELEQKVRAQLENRQDANRWMEVIRRYTEITALDESILFELVDRIEVGEARKVNGQRILTNEVYTGNLVQNQTGSRSYKDDTMIYKPESEWIRHEALLEAIISPEVWNEVQAINRERTRLSADNAPPKPFLFTGKLVCADCKAPLQGNRETQRRKNGTSKKYVSYFCSRYTASGYGACSRHTIYEMTLTELVLSEIRAHAEALELDEAAMLDRLQAQRTAADAERLESVRQEIGKLRRRVYELEQMTAKLYEDKVCGSISAASFAVLLEKTEQERRQRTDRLDTLLEEVREYEQSAADIQSWAAVVRKHLHIRELDRETVDELIDRIEVGEKTVVDGKNVRDIKIYYRFVGNI